MNVMTATLTAQAKLLFLRFGNIYTTIKYKLLKV